LMEPKTKERAANFRRTNRKMPRRRHDITVEKVNYKNPEYLNKFVSETGKIYPRRVTGVSASLHRRITREIKRSRALNLMR
ncbi:MAG: 30S ribosomal protein S18, partial [Verrucomicrobiales bacterium]